MASGARTVLLSRWRTGGQTSFDLVREFAQELPHTAPADAWQRAVLLATDSRLNLEAEPRVKRSTGEESPRASHPFFWAGYLLVDCGSLPEGEAPPPAKPPAKAKPPAAIPPKADAEEKPDRPPAKPEAGVKPEQPADGDDEPAPPKRKKKPRRAKPPAE